MKGLLNWTIERIAIERLKKKGPASVAFDAMYEDAVAAVSSPRGPGNAVRRICGLQILQMEKNRGPQGRRSALLAANAAGDVTREIRGGARRLALDNFCSCFCHQIEDKFSDVLGCVFELYFNELFFRGGEFSSRI